MWVVIFNKASDLATLEKRTDTFERFYSPSDGVLFRSKDHNLPLLFAASETSVQQDLVDWIYKSFHPQVLITSGVLLPNAAVTNDFVIPSFCVRAAGRVDVGSPILYEELHFDSELQAQLSEVFKIPVQGCVFSSDKEINDPEEREWIRHHVDCIGLGQLAGPHLLLGKSRGLKVGCAKGLLAEGRRTEIVNSLIEKFMSLKF